MSDELKACEWCGKPLGKFELHERLHCVYALRERAEKAERMVERLIEAGGEIVDEAQLQEPDVSELREAWQALVAEWQARNDRM
jgi:hypothetical protein